jgi:general secretion pathway protein G
VERAKEATLKQDLHVMRDAIDKFFADKGRFPDSLDELAKERYVRLIPLDPITDSATTWQTLPPPTDSGSKGEEYDVKSGADGTAGDGSKYADW